jgi:hypothetical protein
MYADLEQPSKLGSTRSALHGYSLSRAVAMASLLLTLRYRRAQLGSI